MFTMSLYYNTHIKMEMLKEHTFECNLPSGIYLSLAEVALHPLRKQITCKHKIVVYG